MISSLYNFIITPAMMDLPINTDIIFSVSF